jgi:hypothetical protein
LYIRTKTLVVYRSAWKINSPKFVGQKFSKACSLHLVLEWFAVERLSPLQL